MKTAHDIEPGDTVFVENHHFTSLGGEKVLAFASGKSCIVTKVTESPDRLGFPTRHAGIRLVRPGFEMVYETLIPLEHLRLVQKGPGYFKLGETHPFTEPELKALRRSAYIKKCEEADIRYEGFCNQATFLVWNQLNQEPKTRQTLLGFIRKDGSINPKKVENLFWQKALTIDPAALMSPVEPPAEFTDFARVHRPGSARMRPNWQEVANTLALSLGEEHQAA